MPAMSKLNFKETHFTYPTLTPITGYPTFQDIQQLRRETSANLISVESPLNEEHHGHIGLGLPAATYQRAFAAVYVRAPNPGPYVPPADLNNELAQQRAEKRHKELKEEYRFVNLLERTCLNLIKKALDPSILISKTDRYTGIINGTIPEIFQYLFDSYGNITGYTLESKRQSLLSMTYVHAQPLDVVFHAVDDYADMAEAYHATVTEDQLVHFASMILMKANIYAETFEKWNEEQVKNWNTFQTFFTAAQQKYKRARPSETAAALGYAQANSVTVSTPATANNDLADAEAYIAQLEEAQAIAQAQANLVAPSPPPVATSSNDALLQQLINQIAQLQTKVNTTTPKKEQGKERKISQDSSILLDPWLLCSQRH